MSTIEKPADVGFATRAQIAGAVATDAVALVAPFIVAAVVAIFVPFVASSVFLISIVFGVAAISAGIAFARDAVSLGRYGYTEGFRKFGLRVVDPTADETLYKARIFPKSIWKLLAGRYEVISIGATS